MGREDARQKIPMIFLLKCLLLSYLLTAVLLLLLAFLLYQLGLSEKVVSVAIILIYVAATLSAGFVAGKRLQTRKFLWGLLLGVAYFLLLTVVSLTVGASPGESGTSFLTTFILCAGGGMLGGMLS